LLHHDMAEGITWERGEEEERKGEKKRGVELLFL
jgi:hypothetical protein